MASTLPTELSPQSQENILRPSPEGRSGLTGRGEGRPFLPPATSSNPPLPHFLTRHRAHFLQPLLGDLSFLFSNSSSALQSLFPEAGCSSRASPRNQRPVLRPGKEAQTAIPRSHWLQYHTDASRQRFCIDHIKNDGGNNVLLAIWSSRALSRASCLVTDGCRQM